MIRFFHIFAALFLLFPAYVYGSGRVFTVTEDDQLRLGDVFMAEGEYYRAVTEYKKFIILFPDSEKADYAEFRIGMAYLQGDEFEKAAQAFELVGSRYAGSSFAPAAAYNEGLSYVRLNETEKADAAFNKALALYPASEYARSSLIGKSLIKFDRKDIPGCRKLLEQYLADYPRDDRADRVKNTLTLLNQNRELTYKSPVAAGILSAIVPGSGHIYAGHYGDGITSLFLNGLFIAGTVVAVEHENYALAGVVGLIGMPFYVGNIYGAANAATKYNIGIRKDLRGRITVMLDYRF